MKSNSIGVFDSGFGGISVLKQLRQEMPNENFIYYGDSLNAPYGNKSKSEITDRCIWICDFLINKNVKAIVVACNSATSACIELLRERYSIPIIGMEPALKVLADKYHGSQIVVMATEYTLKEEKFASLMHRYGATNEIISMPCPLLVEIIEKHEFLNQAIVEQALDTYKSDLDAYQVDGIVLGCTHFVFFKTEIEKRFKGVEVVDGNIGTSKHLQAILKSKNLLNTQSDNGSYSFYNSADTVENREIALELLNDV